MNLKWACLLWWY